MYLALQPCIQGLPVGVMRFWTTFPVVKRVMSEVKNNRISNATGVDRKKEVFWVLGDSMFL